MWIFIPKKKWNINRVQVYFIADKIAFKMCTNLNSDNISCMVCIDTICISLFFTMKVGGRSVETRQVSGTWELQLRHYILQWHRRFHPALCRKQAARGKYYIQTRNRSLVCCGVASGRTGGADYPTTSMSVPTTRKVNIPSGHIFSMHQKKGGVKYD